jgi:hypothetical protein
MPIDYRIDNERENEWVKLFTSGEAIKPDQAGRVRGLIRELYDEAFKNGMNAPDAPKEGVEPTVDPGPLEPSPGEPTPNAPPPVPESEWMDDDA